MATPRVITVSQLRCACLDAAWRRRWLAGENPSTMGRCGNVDFPVQGTLFHQLARQFTDWLTQPGGPVGRQTGAQLWAILYDRFALPKLNELLARDAIPSAHHLSRALENFCHRLADLQGRAGSSFRTWRDLFLTHEYDLTRIPVATSGGTILVSGRPDAVRHVHGVGLEVVDYKLSRGSSLKEDLLQLAAYAELLRLAKPGLQFAGVLEFYEPTLHLNPVHENDLRSLWQSMILPCLAELASAGNKRGEAAVPPRPASTPPTKGAHPTPSAELASSDFSEVGSRIERTYASFGLPVRTLGKTEGPQLVRYRVEPGQGVRVVSLSNRAEDLQVALHLSAPPLIQAAAGCVTIDLPKSTPDPVRWSTLATPSAAPPMQFPIGLGVEGQIITADFSDPNTCHALVAGVAGSGKSEFLKSLVASLLRKNPPERLRLSLIDPKAVTFAPLAQCPHLAGPVMTDLQKILLFLEGVVEEMTQRYATLAAAGHENLTQRGADAAMPHWLIVFDEFADLILAGRKEKQAFESLVARIAQMGRAAGIHLVLATQRPDRNIVSGLIKGNLPLKVCLRVTNAINSQIVLDSPGAETLLGKGDLLCDFGKGLQRAQSPLISAEELRGLCGR